MSVTGVADGAPVKVGAAVVDLGAGCAVAGIEAALVERERTGAGRHVEVSLLDSVLTSLLNQGSGWVSARAARRGGATVTRASRGTRPTRPPTGRSRSRAATSACSRGCARRSVCPSSRPTSASRRTPRAWPTSTSWATRWRRSSARSPRRTGSRSCARRACRWGRSTTSPRPTRWPRKLGLEPSVEADGVPLARPPVGTLRRRPPRLEEQGDEIGPGCARAEPVEARGEDAHGSMPARPARSGGGEGAAPRRRDHPPAPAHDREPPRPALLRAPRAAHPTAMKTRRGEFPQLAPRTTPAASAARSGATR